MDVLEATCPETVEPGRRLVVNVDTVTPPCPLDSATNVVAVSGHDLAGRPVTLYLHVSGRVPEKMLVELRGRGRLDGK